MQQWTSEPCAIEQLANCSNGFHVSNEWGSIQWALEVSSLFDNKRTNRRIKKERRQHEAANWNKCLPLPTKNIRLLIVCTHYLFPKTFKWTEIQREWKEKTQRSLRFGLFCVIWVTSISWWLFIISPHSRCENHDDVDHGFLWRKDSSWLHVFHHHHWHQLLCLS